jgi:hypothetical protein
LEAIILAAKEMQRRMADASTTEDEIVEDRKKHAASAGSKMARCFCLRIFKPHLNPTGYPPS